MFENIVSVLNDKSSTRHFEHAILARFEIGPHLGSATGIFKYLVEKSYDSSFF
jgi:hypothetical protein